MTLESFAAVAFDCDSTLSTIEGIDELAARRGCEADIAPLTTAAMEGRLAIEDVYGKRLDVLKPTAEDLAWLGRRYVDTLVEGADRALERLRAGPRQIFIISGGLRGPVLALAAHLNVPEAHVFAVDVYTDAHGRYAGYDSLSPLTRSNGKGIIARQLKARFGSVALIGDGVTDIAAREGGAFVIGFGGVVRRPAVVAGADHFISGPALDSVADYLLG